MNTKLYKQHDSRWRYLAYPTKKCNVGHAGCGLVSCTHIAIEQTAKKDWTPKTLRPYMVKKGYAVAGHGTTWQGIYDTLKYLGHKKVVWVKKNDPMSKAWAEFDKGNRMAILLMNNHKAKNGIRWTSGGHYIAALDIKKSKDGKDHLFYIKDSGPRDHDSSKHGYYSYKNSLQGCVAQLWIVERLPNPKPKPKQPYKGSLPKGTVKKGSKGKDVKALQTFLNWSLGTKLSVDGNAGKHTIDAVKRWQKARKIKVDGVFGSQSRKAAETEIKKYAK